MKVILSKERTTPLEGSLGTEKEYYGLKKIRACSPEMQNVWAGAAAIFFGIFTANAVRLSKKT